MWIYLVQWPSLPPAFAMRAFGYKGSWPKLTGLFNGALQCQTAMLPDLDTPTLVFVWCHRAFLPGGEFVSGGESITGGEFISGGAVASKRLSVSVAASVRMFISVGASVSMPAAGSGGASVSEGQLALKQKLVVQPATHLAGWQQVSCANVPTMRPCPVVMLKQGAGLFVRLCTGFECVASRAPTPLSVEALWQLAGWVRPSDVLLRAQVDFHFQAQQLSRELRQVYASSKARPRCWPVRRRPGMLPECMKRTRHRPVRTPSSSSEELLTDEAMARRRGRVRAPASAGGGSTTHVFRRRCSSCGSSDVIRSRIVGTGRANSLGPSVRLPSGNSQPPQVRKVGAGQQKPWSQKAFDSTRTWRSIVLCL